MYAKKKLWLNRCVIAFAIFLNASIIAVAYEYSHMMLAVLIVLIPLLIIGVYRLIQPEYLNHKHFIKKKEALIQKTKRNVRWFPELMYPNKIAKPDLYVMIGNEQCSEPCKVCVINIETNYSDEIGQMPNSRERGHPKNPGLGGIAGYRMHDGGFVLQIDLNHLFWRNKFGQFNSTIFKQVARRSEVKMIELKLNLTIHSKPSIFSSLQTINRKTETKYSNIFDAAHGMFCHAEGLIHFLDCLRELSGGKPVGIKIGDIEGRDLHETCHAIRKTQIVPDFIVVESSEKETRSIEMKLRGRGKSSYETLLLVSNILETYSLKKRVKIVAVGKIVHALDVLKMLALGANVVYTKTDDCNMIEYSVEKSNKAPLYKSQTLDDFHKGLMEDTIRKMKSCGFKSISDLTLLSFLNNLDILYSKSFKELDLSILNPVLEREFDGTKGKAPESRTKQKIRSYQ
jgi:hypothetical protein